MMADALLPVALALCLAGPVLLRLGWHRSRGLVALGWTAMALATVLLAGGEAAWGLAAGAAAAMVSAMALLAQATLATAPPRRVIAGRPIASLPAEPVDWTDVRRRAGVFLVVVFLDLGASLLFAWSVQRALFHAGANEADMIALALFLQPLLWLAMVSWQMMQGRLTAMLPTPFTLILAGGILWLAA